MQTLRILLTVLVIVNILGHRAPRSAADELNVNLAINRGVGYLKSQQTDDGSWKINHPLGATALAGLALLESRVRADDPSVSQAVDHVRTNAEKSQHTYSVALAIMLLDRVGNASDKKLIRQLGERLRDAQLTGGDWGYSVPPASDSRKSIVHRGGRGDNSNTQFAVLGLWVARRHGVQVDDALTRAGKYFEQSFKASPGGWGYKLGNQPTPPMTCAGLIGMATYHGVQASLRGAGPEELPKQAGNADRNQNKALKNASVQRAFQYLNGHLQSNRQNVAATDWYFLWSLERVAVIYNQPSIGSVDWYQWGVERILKTQKANGSWKFRWGSVPETCFVLLFLNRANVAPDLTKLVGGPSTLRGGADVSKLNAIAKAAKQLQQVQSASARDAASISAQLAKSEDAAEQARLIRHLEEAKGRVYSEALSTAIGRLSGAAKDSARDALASRFKRMTARTLRSKLNGGDTETRLAAIRATMSKQEFELIPDLIDLVDNRDESLRQAARHGLRDLSGQDFGPSAGASTVESFVAKQRWQKWFAARQ